MGQFHTFLEPFFLFLQKSHLFLSLFFRNHPRISLDEVILSYDTCVSAVHPMWWVIIVLSALFWLFRLVRFCYHAVQFYDIKKFFNNALKIDDVSEFHIKKPSFFPGSRVLQKSQVLLTVSSNIENRLFSTYF